MKSLVEFLSDLRTLDIALSVNGERLVCNAPKNAITPEIGKELAARKQEILAFLRETQALPVSGRAETASREIPLSHSQQRLWFVTQLDRQNPAYNVTIALWLAGELNRDALERALFAIVERHESLRTGFFERNGQPFAKVMDAAGWKMASIDLAHPGLPEAGPQSRPHSRPQFRQQSRPQFPDLRQAEAEAERLALTEARRPFHLERPPLFRANLFEVSVDRALLVLTMHHIVADGWSMGILSHELTALYAAFAAGKPSPLAEPSFQFRDYVQWERDAGQQAADRQMPYWLERLGGALPVLELPGDRRRPLVQTFNGKRIAIAIDGPLAQRVRRLSRETGTTVFMVLLAAFQSLLFRYTGVDDILVGSATSNRPRQEFATLIGFFVNNLVLRTDLSGDPSFSELLKRVQETASAAYAHQSVPFERLVEALRPERGLSHSPLVQVLFTLQNLPLPALRFAGLAVEIAEIDPGISRADLSVEVWPQGQSYRCDFEYNTDLFDERTIRRFQAHYLCFLEAATADPSLAIGGIPLLSPPERRQLLYDWNQTKVEYAGDPCLHELFEEQVAKTPEATAVVFENASLSYAELNRRANRLAHSLRGLGVKPDARVAICVERGFEMIVGLLAILKAGGAYVPLDPAYPIERLRFMLQDSAPTVLLTQSHLRGLFSKQDESLPVLDLSAATAPWQQQAESNPDRAGIGLAARHLAYVIYTSGSTGMPKGVMVEHAGLCNYLRWALESYRPGSAVVSSSLSFDATVTSLYGPLLCGGAARLLREGDEIAGLDIEMRRPEGGMLVKITPAHLEMLGQRMLAEGRHSSVGVVVIGGERLSTSTLRLWRQIQPDVRLVNEYGPTETVVGCVAYEVPKQLNSAESVLIGRPIANTRIYILDASRQPVPMGVVGELYIGGVQVARGYLNRPDLTAERFLPDPFAADVGARMYKTGDLGRWLADGEIEFLGRNDFQVKLRGFRIELGEIEARLAEHPGVRDAVVIAREDIPGDKRLVAYYTSLKNEPESGEAPLPAEVLRAHLSAALPDHMVPAAYVPLDALPLTSNGKLDRKALPPPNVSSLEKFSDLPITEEEKRLAKIWTEILGIDGVGRGDNFFDLGGHSLLLVRLFARINKEFKSDLPITAIFDAQTLSALAEVLRDKARISSLVPVRTSGSKPPLFMAHSYLLYHGLSGALGENQPFYGLRELPEDGNQSIEERALRYVADMRSVQPHGPYRIGGWCAAGALAAEIARQLILAGEQVALLVLFDSWLPGYAESLKSMDGSKSYARMLTGKLFHHKTKLAGLSLAERMRYLWGVFGRMGREARGRLYVRHWSNINDFYKWLNIPLPQFMYNATPQFFAASRQFRVERIPVNVTLICASDSRPIPGASISHGWEKIAERGVDILWAPGDHETMFRGNNLKVTAELVSHALANTQPPDPEEAPVR